MSDFYDQTRPSLGIHLEGLSKTYALPGGERLEAVRNVSLQVKAGEVFGLIGTSGAGKSTLLRLINRLEQPDTGRVQVGDQDITGLDKKALRLARQRMGMVFQQFNLLQNATVYDNIAFPLRLHGNYPEGEVFRRVLKCLAIVGLKDKITSLDQITDPDIRVAVDSPGGLVNFIMNLVFKEKGLGITVNDLENVTILGDGLFKPRLAMVVSGTGAERQATFDFVLRA